LKIKDLKPAPYNPRKISDEKLEMLDKSMQEFGDLSGIVLNRKTGNLVGGHMRIKTFDSEWPIIKEEYQDAVGTVAIGYIETPSGRWIYREVDWPKKREAPASVSANKQGGEWDFPKLTDVLLDHDDGSFDMDLTGFDESELEEMMVRVPPELPGEGEGNGSSDNNNPLKCPKCGYEFTDEEMNP